MNTPYSAKAENPALKEFLSIDMNSAGKLPFLSDCQKRRLFLLFFFIFMLLFPSLANSTDLNLSNTWLNQIRGPEGTRVDLKLDDGSQTLYRTGKFNDIGILQIKDLFNPDSTGIDEIYQIIPSNTHYINTFNTNLIFAPKYSEHSKSQQKVLDVAVYNGNGQVVAVIPFHQHNGFITANWNGNGKSNSQYYFGVKTEDGTIYKQFTYLKEANSSIIPETFFKKAEENNNKNVENINNNDLEEIIRKNSKVNWNVEFTYTCDPEGPNEYHHEQTKFNEQINSDLSWFTPEHYLTPLVQRKHVNFNVVDGYTGNGLNNANVRLLDGERNLIEYIAVNENGEFQILNAPTDSTLFVEVSHPDFRNIEYDFYVSKRIALNDTIASNPYYGITTVADKDHYIALFKEPGNYSCVSNGVEINNPDLTMTRILEGQIYSEATNSDGRVVRDLVMGDVIPCWNLTDLQKSYLDKFAKIFHGKSSFNDLFSEAPSERYISDPNYNYIIGDVNAGINWGVDGNNTEAYEKYMYDHNGNLFSYMVMGGITNSGGELSTFHEQLNYDYLSPIPLAMDSSPANSTANMWTDNDPLSIQYVYDVEEAKYKNGWSTIETSDLRKDVEDFKSNNPSNVIDLKTAR